MAKINETKAKKEEQTIENESTLYLIFSTIGNRKHFIVYSISAVLFLTFYMITLNTLIFNNIVLYYKVNKYETVDITKLRDRHETEFGFAKKNGTTESHVQDDTSYASGDLYTFNPDEEDLAFFRATCIEARLTFVSEDMSDLYNLDTPQGKAFDWLLNKDGRALHPDAENLVQRYVLAVLYFSTAGEEWFVGSSHWMNALHECHWKRTSRGITYGVTECDENHRVTKLHLPDNNLRGKFPFEMGCLTQLRVLDLNLNYLTGTIPDSLVFLDYLHTLHLNNNQLSGSIPSELGLLSHLETVQLEVNDLNGTVPPSLCALTNKSLDVLMVDCLGSNVKCSCCSLCCDHVTGFCARVDEYGFISDDFIMYDQLF